MRKWYSMSQEEMDWILSSYRLDGDDLVWARNGTRGVKSGDRVPAYKNSSGYYTVKVNVKPRKTMLLHRVKWVVAYGECPNGDVDHINRDPSDNRLENLRLASRSQNKINSHKKSRENGLPLGVYQRGEKYCATISFKRERKFLGAFETPKAAHDAWVSAGSQLYGEFMPCQF